MGGTDCIPVLERGCCGCCELSTCVKVQGVINIIGSIVNIAICIYTISVISELAGVDKLTPEQEAFVTAARVLVGFVLTASIVSLILAILLLRGVQTENRALLLPYLISTSVLIVVNFCLTIASLAAGAASVGVDVFNLMFSTALQLYFLLHVYSLYVQLGTSGGTNYA